MTAEITLCEGDDLKLFFENHGQHYQTCIERLSNPIYPSSYIQEYPEKARLFEMSFKDRKNARSKNRKEFKVHDRVFNNINQIKQYYKGLKAKNIDGNKIAGPAHDMVHPLYFPLSPS